MQKLDKRHSIDFVDVSEGQPESCPISQDDLLARFHVKENGRIYSGAQGFAAMWRAIPILRPFGQLARLPGLRQIFEVLYKGFLRVRPRLQRLVSD